MNNNPQLILASASARRKRLLSEAGIAFSPCSPDVDESACSRSVKKTVLNNAILKNEWAAARHNNAAIIAADTAIDFEGRLIGKPENMENARAQLKAFSGKTHLVLTGISCSCPGQPPFNKVAASPVLFRILNDDIISRYFELTNPLDKAGSYDIGSRGDLIIKSYKGSLSNIIGLPMELVTPWCERHGYIS